MGTLAPGQRKAVLVASYITLMIIAWMAWATMQIHLGAISVIPLLFIAYYVRPTVALLTAFVSGVVIALLDLNLLYPSRQPVFVPPLLDIVILSAALCTVVLVANRLRERDLANEVLRGRLVTARREAERDALTGTANRAAFLRVLGDTIDRSGAQTHVALLFCDLDGFKLINDTHGHLAGDRLLQLAAGRLTNAVRTIDTVARIGGDEFAILAEQMHRADEALHMAANIERAFADPFHSDDERYHIGITVGVSLYPDDGSDPDTLLRIADERMYRAKRSKRPGHAS
jgi:diguanylate cyclase (GGDEF)-like protein